YPSKSGIKIPLNLGPLLSLNVADFPEPLTEKLDFYPENPPLKLKILLWKRIFTRLSGFSL
ncbi:hypothetical protein, partial [Siphonobacter sp.]|uniref:hypothetical protein n=1 Tax=Siphonobacter sp. TaxID=1869184 RepID=UPI003B3A906A